MTQNSKLPGIAPWPRSAKQGRPRSGAGKTPRHRSLASLREAGQAAKRGGQISNLYSIRMRASRDKKHISGAERMVTFGEISLISQELIERALNHEIDIPNEIILTVESINNPVIETTALDISTILTDGIDDSRKKASELLKEIGVSEKAIEVAFNSIFSGAAPDYSNMRGAMVIDTSTCERLELDPYRGIRASRMDIRREIKDLFKEKLKGILSGVPNRVIEAVVLATKVSNAPSYLAELCISDNPNYTTGYVASRKSGYVRLPSLKEKGDTKGGRAFFIDGNGFDLSSFIDYIEKKPVLLTAIGRLYAPCSMEEFWKMLNEKNNTYSKSCCR
ncbi:MAG: 6-carboxyhexanoate--CoA ligase [Nitrospirota bacterium]